MKLYTLIFYKLIYILCIAKTFIITLISCAPCLPQTQVFYLKRKLKFRPLLINQTRDMYKMYKKLNLNSCCIQLNLVQNS